MIVHCKSSIHDYVAVAPYARVGDLIKFSKLKAKAVDWNFWPPPILTPYLTLFGIIAAEET